VRIVASTGRDDIAVVYIGEMDGGGLVEFVEATQPPRSRDDKWVLLVSTLFGCPVSCPMCDAGGQYRGKLTAEEVLAQIDFLVRKRFPSGRVPSRQFKIQFARMGEPSLNPAVLDVLEELPRRYDAPGLMPSLSTVAPRGAGRFFDRLLEIKRRSYNGGRFQFQFSLHTTDPALRDELVPVKKLSFAEMSRYGERFYEPGDRKIGLNFALARNAPVEPEVLLRHFSPNKFLVKVTPLNPTHRAEENMLVSCIDPRDPDENVAAVVGLREAGYEVIVSVGEAEENLIGSNCGQFLRAHLAVSRALPDAYTYPRRILD
jgi:23S rRNA (adenine2503-C2)-methyltransferase